MRRLTLLMIVTLLIWSFAAADESIYGKVQIGEGLEAPEAEFTLYMDTEKIDFFTSLLPGWMIEIQSESFGGTFFPQTAEMNPETLQVIQDSWLKIAGVEHKSGVFTGDLFDIATQTDQILFSWSEIAFLLNQIEMTEEIPEAVKVTLPEIRRMLTKTAINLPEMRFKLNLYNEISAVSLTVINDNTTIGTISLRQGAGNSIQLLIGNAENGKTYYRYWQSEKKEPVLIFRGSAWADDHGAGYKNLPQNAIILREELQIDETEKENRPFTYSSVDGNGKKLISANGLMTAAPEWKFHAEVTYGNQDAFLGRIEIRQAEETEDMLPLQAKVLNLSNPNEAIIKEFLSDVTMQASTFGFTLFKYLPAELILLLMKN